MRKSLFSLFLVIIFSTAGCFPTQTDIATMTAMAWTPTFTSTPTPTFTNTPIPTATLTPTVTLSPTPEATATPTETPTPEKPMARALMNAFCRWGPGEAFRSSGALFRKDALAAVDGKRITGDGTWYWIKMEDVNWNCWVHSTTLKLLGDVALIRLVRVYVPENGNVPSPLGVSSSRGGDKVTISWQPAPSAPELEYLIEAIICTSGGYLLEVAYNTTNNKLTFTDTKQCSSASFGTLRVANKLGYSSPVKIPWP